MSSTELRAQKSALVFMSSWFSTNQDKTKPKNQENSMEKGQYSRQMPLEPWGIANTKVKPHAKHKKSLKVLHVTAKARELL